jgi:hypothetical protein
VTLESDKILWGAGPIGRAINRTPRQVYHLAETGQIPVMKVGNILTSTERRLREHILGGGKPVQASVQAE